jgi:crotonobetaine/carnitine-CoA ligase
MSTAETQVKEDASTTPSNAYRTGVRDTVVHALARAVRRNAEGLFINVGGDRYSYGEIDRLSNRLAHSLASLGVSKGDTVVTIFDTSVDVMTCWFAINKLGAIWVPINTAYEGEFLRHQISDSQARVIICEPHYVPRVAALAEVLPEVKKVLVRNAAELPDCAVGFAPLDAYRGEDDSPLPCVVQPRDLAALLYTSGTTGPSKGCMMSHNYFCMWGRQQLRAVPLSREDISWTCLPLFHSAALILVMGSLVEGFPCAIWPRFSVSNFWQDMEDSGATKTLLMASIFALVAKAPDSEVMHRCRGQLKMIYGQPISPEVREIWKTRFGVKVVSSWAYGQTEGVRLSMATPDETPPERSCGRIADEFIVKIFDADDCPVPDGETGEIVFQPREANTMFEGYWKRPELTASVWRNLWMHTGDLGRIENGYLYFTDRAKDYLRCRGENVSSFEVERTFMAHPDVAEVAVHAVGQQAAEDEIKATIVLRAGVSLTEHELCLWSIERLPYFAAPRYFEFRSELLKNPTGKVLKYRLRDEGVTASTWDRQACGIEVRRRK